MKDPISHAKYQRSTVITIVVVLLALFGVLMFVSGCSTTNTVEPSPEAAETTSVEVVEPTTTPEPTEDAVPSEFLAAVAKAQLYVESMPFSEKGLYDQLTAEMGEQFSPEAANYAIDMIEVNWNEEALEAAMIYLEDLHMSPDAIHEQLVHPNGNQFTNEQADYAVANLP